MLKFLRNLLASLRECLVWPFRFLFGSGHHGAAEDVATEAADRAQAVQAATAPDHATEDALLVRRAARALTRGEVPECDMPLRRWLEALPPAGLAFVSRAKVETLRLVLSGQPTDACPVPAFIRSEWDGTAILASYRADRAGRSCRIVPASEAAEVPYAESLSRTIRAPSRQAPPSPVVP